MVTEPEAQQSTRSFYHLYLFAPLSAEELPPGKPEELRLVPISSLDEIPEGEGWDVIARAEDIERFLEERDSGNYDVFVTVVVNNSEIEVETDRKYKDKEHYLGSIDMTDPDWWETLIFLNSLEPTK